MKRRNAFKNTHLTISSFVVILVAVIFGFAPNVFFKLTLNTGDEKNILKGIMGIYLAFALLWILGANRSKFWKIATVSNIIFMFGLAFGRLVSMLFDGIPSLLLILGFCGEIILGSYGVYIFQQHQKRKTI